MARTGATLARGSRSRRAAISRPGLRLTLTRPRDGHVPVGLSEPHGDRWAVVLRLAAAVEPLGYDRTYGNCGRTITSDGGGPILGPTRPRGAWRVRRAHLTGRSAPAACYEGAGVLRSAVVGWSRGPGCVVVVLPMGLGSRGRTPSVLGGMCHMRGEEPSMPSIRLGRMRGSVG